MRTGTAQRTFELALVEESRSEAWLILEALKKNRRKLNVAVFPDGDRAWDYLQGPHQEHSFPFRLPDLILVNLNIPRKGALDLLAEIRSSLELKDVPVVVLAGDSADPGIPRSYELGANCVLTKPLELGSYVDTLRAAGHYWLDVMGRTKAPLAAAGAAL
jgi:CheY-like chemotaxis protein